jgi:two-component system heavy metal sensor histidine kinase CusS
MIHSFRLRLAIYSALLTGLVLLAFGLSSWWLIRNARIERIDNTLKFLAEREVNRPAIPDEDWDKIKANMAASLGLRDPGNLLLLLQDGQGQTIYQSAQWPAGLDVNSLPWPRRKQNRPADNALSWLVGNALADEANSGDVQNGQPFVPPGSMNNRPRMRPFPPPGERPFPPGQFFPRPGRNQLPAQRGETGNNTGTPTQELRPPPALRPVSGIIGRKAAGQTWRIGLASSGRGRAAVAVNLVELSEEMQGVRNAFLIALAISLSLISLGAWIFSSRALRPLEKLNAATRQVTAEGLNKRIPAANEDREFAELIEVFNGMLRRLERSFQQAQRFSADAAHELKTPLAILQGQLERAINGVEAGSPIQVELSGILDEVRRLSTISRKLLLLSQADAGRLKIQRAPVNLSEVLDSLAEDTQMLAPHLKVKSNIRPGMTISADISLLQQVMHNLVSNAIKYNIKDGWIDISAGTAPGLVKISVSNSSRGIPASERERVFERFYRADPSHNRKVEGVGLGLALSREIVRAHGGDLLFEVNQDNSVKFSIVLPAR